MKAAYNKQRSWDKQKVYDLENGYRVTVEYHQTYGDFVKRIDAPDGNYWCASNGHLVNNYKEHPTKEVRETFGSRLDLPEFAVPWSDGKMIRPNFEKVDKIRRGG